MEIIFRFTQTIVALPLSVCLLLDKERLEGNLNFLKIIGYLWKSLDIFGNLWKFLEIIGNLWRVKTSLNILEINLMQLSMESQLSFG